MAGRRDFFERMASLLSRLMVFFIWALLLVVFVFVAYLIAVVEPQ